MVRKLCENLGYIYSGEHERPQIVWGNNIISGAKQHQQYYFSTQSSKQTIELPVQEIIIK